MNLGFYFGFSQQGDQSQVGFKASKGVSNGKENVKGDGKKGQKRNAMGDITNTQLERPGKNSKQGTNMNPASSFMPVPFAAQEAPSESQMTYSQSSATQQVEKVPTFYQPTLAETLRVKSSQVDEKKQETHLPNDENAMPNVANAPGKELLVDSPMEIECTETLPHKDIDAHDLFNPLYVTDYIDDIFQYLRDNELNYRPATDFMELVQRDVTAPMRTILCDWMVEVAEEFALVGETLYLAINYVDRYLSKKSINRKKLQLVGVTALFVASKYEEVQYTSLDEYVYIADHTYTAEEIIQMELELLDALDFNLTIATPKVFLRRYTKAAECDLLGRRLANYFCELAMMDYKFIKYLPSKLASAAVYLTQHTLGHAQPWTSTVEYFSEYTAENLSDAVNDLWLAHKNASTTSPQAVYQKYASQSLGAISTCIKPVRRLPAEVSH